MDMKFMQGKAGQFIALALVLLVVVFAALSAMFAAKSGELEGALSEAQASASKAQQDAQSQRKKGEDALKAANAKIATLEQERAEAEKLKALLASVEPQLAPVLEAASRAKTGKPDARAAGLVGLGLIAQVAHGAKHEAALANLDRALAIDSANCAAGLAINLGGAKKVDLAPECAALLPAAPAAAAPAPAPAPAAKDAKPATEAKAAEAKPAATPAATAPAAAKN
jgi:Tfp pilus assembly protein PilX